MDWRFLSFEDEIWSLEKRSAEADIIMNESELFEWENHYLLQRNPVWLRNLLRR